MWSGRCLVPGPVSGAYHIWALKALVLKDITSDFDRSARLTPQPGAFRRLISSTDAICLVSNFSSGGSKQLSSPTLKKPEMLRVRHWEDAWVWKSKFHLGGWPGSFQHWWFVPHSWNMFEPRLSVKRSLQSPCARQGKSVKPLEKQLAVVARRKASKGGKTPEEQSAWADWALRSRDTLWPWGWEIGAPRHLSSAFCGRD